MTKLLWISLGAAATTAGAAIYWHRRGGSPSTVPPLGGVPVNPTPAPADPVEPIIPTPKSTGTKPLEWTGVKPLPTSGDVKGDLSRNWGKTPMDLRSLFLLMEEVSGIVGAGRIFSIIAYRESRYVATAHNGDGQEEQAERNRSWEAYQNNKDRNPPLAAAEAAASFGSGGLFGALTPYFLWSGIQELGTKAPLLSADPRIMFLPRVAAFAACVYLQRLLAHYEIKDHADIKVGWGSISLLKEPGRGGETYQAIRTMFLADAATVGIDLNDASTIPQKLSVSAWPGVAKVWEALVGTMPQPRLA